MPENEEEHDWPARLTQVIAQEIKRHRKARGMSVQQLSDAVERLGLPIARPVLSNLENARRHTISVAEVLVLAEALDVPPLQLIVPAGYADSIEIVPNVDLRPSDAIAWIRGHDVPPELGRSDEQANTYYRYLMEWDEHLRTQADLMQLLFRDQRPEIGSPEHIEWERERAALEELARDERRQIRASGREPEPLPDGLAYLDEQRPPPPARRRGVGRLGGPR